MINVVCVKAGTKYNSEFVNRLYRMVEKNLSLPFDFYCLTEDTTGIRKEVKIKDISEEIEEGLSGFWPKFLVFNPEIYDIPGETVFFDLDIIIQNNFDHFFKNIEKDKIKILHTGTNDVLLEYEINVGYYYETEVNSSVMVFNSNEMIEIYNYFINDMYSIMEKYKGVCRVLWNKYKYKLQYLKVFEDHYSLFFSNAEMQKIKDFDTFQIYIDVIGDTIYYVPNCTIALLNGQSDIWHKTEGQQLRSFFSDYYK